MCNLASDCSCIYFNKLSIYLPIYVSIYPPMYLCIYLAKKCEDKYVPAICEGYGVLMNVRWQELSLIQKINTILLGVGHTTARVISS